ncbi:MAG: sigma-70 family RNA polymerase sigma factor [Erysipelotrichaceae bacterium]|nr:sigma-70 family RNA polymerase sigma factor [Erysipelotrichaceae bacterium]
MGENIYELLYMALSEDSRAYELMYSYFNGIFNRLYNEMSVICQFYNYDDAMADCYMTMVTAVHTYRRDLDLQFSSFVYLLCKRAMFNSIRQLKRQHYYEGEIVYSLDYKLQEEQGSYLQDVTSQSNDDDCSREIILESTLEMILKQQFTPQENEVFQLRRQGYSYLEIAEMTKLPYKKVDNILQKMRRKIASSFD